MHGIIKRIRRLPGMVFPAAVCLVLLSCGKGIGPYDNSKNPNTDMSASLSFDNDTAYQPGGDKSPESSDSFILEEAPATNAADNTSGINLQDSAVEPSSETYGDSMTVTDDSAQTVEPSVYEEAVTQNGAATATQTAGTEPTADTEENIAALKDMPVWAFVGARDEIVRPDSSIELVSSLKDAGGSARVTVFREADHFSVPELSYLNENLGLLDWLIGE